MHTGRLLTLCVRNILLVGCKLVIEDSLGFQNLMRCFKILWSLQKNLRCYMQNWVLRFPMNQFSRNFVTILRKTDYRHHPSIKLRSSICHHPLVTVYFRRMRFVYSSKRLRTAIMRLWKCYWNWNNNRIFNTTIMVGVQGNLNYRVFINYLMSINVYEITNTHTEYILIYSVCKLWMRVEMIWLTVVAWR